MQTFSIFAQSAVVIIEKNNPFMTKNTKRSFHFNCLWKTKEQHFQNPNIRKQAVLESNYAIIW